MKGSLETKIGIFVVLAIIAGVLSVELAGELSFLKKGYTVRTYFDDAGDLRPGDPVKLGGIPIGSVNSIGWSEQIPGKVEIALFIESGTPIKTDSVAQIRFKGLLGSQFVALSFGSAQAPIIDDNAILESEELPDLGDLMERMESVAGGVENMTKTFSGDSFADLLAPLSDFVRVNTPRLTKAIENLESISDTLAKGEGTVGKLINDDELYAETMGVLTKLESTFEKASGSIESTLNDAQEILSNVKSGEGTMGQLLTQKKLYNEMESSMSALKEILSKINQGKGSVGLLVNDETFFNNLKLTLQKIEKATETLEDTGPISVLNNAANSLF